MIVKHCIEKKHSVFIVEKIKARLCKGVYPYEHMDSVDKYNETRLASFSKYR